MATDSIIAWTNHTFNPWMGCEKVSPGCKNCYAERFTRDRMGLKLWGPKGKRQVTSVSYWKQPFKWNREADIARERRRVFCGSLCDWAEDHPIAAERRPYLFDIIRRTPFLDWLLLSKRAERIAECLPKDWGDGWPNVWLGATIEHNDFVHRADCLRAIPATVRFVSYEPALGPLDRLDLRGLDWIIYGGESGPGYRPHDLAWPRDMKRRCEEAAVFAKPGDRWPTFFYKQMAAPRTEMGIELDGEIVRAYPTRALPVVPFWKPSESEASGPIGRH